MTRSVIEKVIRAEIERMRTKTHGCAADKRYQQGKAIGMLRAFLLAGFLTIEEQSEIWDELCEEFF